MNWETWGPVFTALALVLPPIIQTAAKKLMARINNIPDEKQRRQATAEEHVLEMKELAEHRTQHEAMQKTLEENTKALTARDREIKALRIERDALFKENVTLKAKAAAAAPNTGKNPRPYFDLQF